MHESGIQLKKNKQPPLSPLRTVGIILIAVFLVEAAIMQFPLDALSDSDMVIALIDAALLSLFTAPILYYLILRPMRRQIRALRRNRESLLETQSQMEIYRSVIQDTSESVIITDAESSIIYVNPAFTELTGYPEEEVLGRNPSVLSIGDTPKAFYVEMWARLLKDGHWQGELQNRKRSGEPYVQFVTISSITDSDGQPTNFAAVFHDITRRKKEEEKLRHRAHHDFLTGLPNRTLFIDRLDQVIANTRRNRKQAAVLFLDLDRFKPVNDTYGHAVGDMLLVEVAAAIKGQIRNEDTVSRIGGDEFAVILRSITRREDAGLLASKLLERLSQPFIIEDHEISIGASIGIAIFPDDAITFEKLLEQADNAMYSVKQSGRNSYRYVNDLELIEES
ncbi:diguanylate cyclase domain-containing protein [Magnetococcales bacterium HHB-1]